MGLALFLATTISLLSGCGGDVATDTSSGDAAGDQIDLASIDACSFFETAMIQQITGKTVRFVDQGHADPSLSKCFWGAAEPGVPAYVELTVSRYQGEIAGGFDPGCTVSAVDVEGVDAAAGVTCPPNPQRKIYLLAGDRGIKVSLLVNEPARPLTPEDLVSFVESVVETL